MSVYVVKTRARKGNMPANYQFKVVSNGNPTYTDIARALEKEGFPELVGMSYPQNWDIKKVLD